MMSLDWPKMGWWSTKGPFDTENPNPNPKSWFLRIEQRNVKLNQIPNSSKPPLFYQVAASAVFVLSLAGVRPCSALLPPPPPPLYLSLGDENTGKSDNGEHIEDIELQAAFESWKTKTYALTVPLRVVALRGSIPPSWIKEFVQSQGKRLKLHSEFRGSLEDIFSELCTPLRKGNIHPKSAMAADIITIGDSWLSSAINKGLIDPIEGVNHIDWFGHLSDKWKVYLRRDNEGKLDSDGKIWAAPYRWGSMVIAYKKNKFQKHQLAPIEDWADLWRPELGGRISMVDSPREVIGAVLKCMGASYNTDRIENQVAGGIDAVQQKLALLEKQVLLFDSVHYLKAFSVGDAWVAVGWSSDVIPAAKRMSNVAVIVPKSGASLWADLWAIPATSKCRMSKGIGGRVRGASPLIHQWIDFCLQSARALPFKQEVIAGASPFAGPTQDVTQQGNQPKLDTNLVNGVPPPDIIDKCEFLEPLSHSALSDYHSLLPHSTPSPAFIHKLTSMFHNFSFKPT